MSLEADGVIAIYEIETGKLIAVYEGLDVHYEVERLREVERKALEQSEYIQKHGLTEWEMALKNAEIARLRGALEAVEWVQDTGNGDYYCPWCDNNKLVGHHADCQRQTALDAAGGGK